jgi:urease accessory protein
MKTTFRIATLAVATALLPLAAQAHPGHGAGAGFLTGLAHPLTGWDHLTVLLCLGVLAAGCGWRMALGAGLLLATALSAGAAIGLAMPRSDLIEPALVVTVLASVSLLFVQAYIGRGVLLTLCLAFALVHGVAHGQEAPAGGVAAYFAGFTLASVALYVAGILGTQRLRHRWGARASNRPQAYRD